MEGQFWHMTTENDTDALRRLVLDLQNGNPYRLPRWRAKEEEILEAVRTAHPIGYSHKGLRAWIPQAWMDVFFRAYQ